MQWASPYLLGKFKKKPFGQVNPNIQRSTRRVVDRSPNIYIDISFSSRWSRRLSCGEHTASDLMGIRKSVSLLGYLWECREIKHSSNECHIHENAWRQGFLSSNSSSDVFLTEIWTAVVSFPTSIVNLLRTEWVRHRKSFDSFLEIHVNNIASSSDEKSVTSSSEWHYFIVDR